MIKHKNGLQLTGKGKDRRWRRTHLRVEIGPREQAARELELKKAAGAGGIGPIMQEIGNLPYSIAYHQKFGRRDAKDINSMLMDESQKRAARQHINKENLRSDMAFATSTGARLAENIGKGMGFGVITKHLEHMRRDNELNKTARALGYTPSRRMRVDRLS